MTAYAQLARIARWRLGEARRKLAEIERLAANLRQDIANLDAILAEEAKLVSDNLESRRYYATFLRAEQARRRKLEQSIAELEREAEIAREEVSEAFREVKKYEMAEAARIARKREIAERREQAAMDEIGRVQHRRQAGKS